MQQTESIQQPSESLILKLPFYNPLFREHDLLLKWPFSRYILVTAYDLYKDDTLVTNLQRTGSTLREWLLDHGFNSNVKILSDTGIFEMECRKARIKLKGECLINANLTTKEIFEAYHLIDPDLLVSPDEIILLEDDSKTVKRKTEVIINNLNRTINLFPKKKIIATLQGIDEHTMRPILDEISDYNLTKVARGGLLPLRRQSRQRFKTVLKLSEQISRQYDISHLHAFGLSNMYVLRDYFQENSYDTVDSSILYYKTADRKYLLKSGKTIYVRKANFEVCNCLGCQIMNKSKYYAETSGKFAVGLYSHNALTMGQLAYNFKNKPSRKYCNKTKKKQQINPQEHNRRKPSKNPSSQPNRKNRKTGSKPKLNINLDEVLIPASSAKDKIAEENTISYIHKLRLGYLNNYTNKVQAKIENSKIAIIFNFPTKKLSEVENPERTNLFEYLIERPIYQKIKQIAIYQEPLHQNLIFYITPSLFLSLEELEFVTCNELLLSLDNKIASPTIQKIPDFSTHRTIIFSFPWWSSKPQLLIKILSEISETETTEIVVFSKKWQTPKYKTDTFIQFSIKEFVNLEEWGISFHENIGKSYFASLSIISNYLQSSCLAKNKRTSFVTWWHNLYNCTCIKENHKMEGKEL